MAGPRSAIAAPRNQRHIKGQGALLPAQPFLRCGHWVNEKCSVGLLYSAVSIMAAVLPSWNVKVPTVSTGGLFVGQFTELTETSTLKAFSDGFRPGKCESGN